MTNKPNTRIPIDDLQTFAEKLSEWHSRKVQVINQLMQIPDGTVFSVEDGEDQVMTGDIRQGFLVGLTVALAELGKLPFYTEYDDGSSHALH